MQDQYYWGETDHAPYELTPYTLLNYGLTSFWHTMVSFMGIYIGLGGIHTIQTLLCMHVLGSTVIGIPGEGWMYPPLYGPLSAAFEKGIRGWWGTFWHQSFRLPLTAAGTWVISSSRIDPQSQVAKVVRLLVAFALSGGIHFAESCTTWPRTSPWKAYAFFLLQPMGIIAQDSIRKSIWGQNVQGKWAKRSMHMANAVTTMLWFLLTFPLWRDDIARAGLWLVEPWPVSPSRAIGGSIGLLPADEGWQWRWNGPFVEWYHGSTWWRSGLRIL